MRSTPSERGAADKVPPAQGRVSEEWIERWRRGGGEECLQPVFALNYRKVFAFFLRHGFAEEDCRDLAQETFARAFTHLDSFRGDARFATWLFQIMENVRRNALRDRRAQKRQAQEVALDAIADLLVRAETIQARQVDEPSPLEQVLAGERSRRLHEAVDQLPAQMRHCVKLRIEQGLKYRDIADSLRLSIETVKAHLFQARQVLRLKLGDLA